jgi:hypothetical protein
MSERAPSDRRPWRDLPAETFAVVTPLLPAITEEIIVTIRDEVPDYAKPLEGTFGRTVRLGVDQALKQFVGGADDATGSPAAGREVYLELGRGELRTGRSIGALLAAYRVGARVAWRRMSEAGLAAGLEQQSLNRLAESIFAYIDEISAISAEGYALEQAVQAGETDRRRAELVELLVRPGRGPSTEEIAAAAAAAGWRVPAQIAVIVWSDDHHRRPIERLSADVLVAEAPRPGAEHLVCAIDPDPVGPGRRDQLRAALAGIECGVGSAAPPALAAGSWRHARAALDLAQRRVPPAPVFADESRADLIARADPTLTDAIEVELLNAFGDQTPLARERLRATLLAWLRHDGNVSEAARELHVHAQTVRYRMAQIRDLLGAGLDEPDVRFELEVALRASA